MFRNLIHAALVAAITVSSVTHTSADSGKAIVIDGDSILINQIEYRLHGIDTPETAQTCRNRRGGRWDCGAAATNRLKQLIEGRLVSCEPREIDQYGRTIAVCRTNEGELNKRLIEEGLAWAFVKYSKDYIVEEAVARKAEIGVWQAENMPPWEFREKGWGDAEIERPDGCVIKGNINRKGERIYHAPWSNWYSRTKINEAKGERWFCTEGEARTAGWRAPYQ
ncbi:MAG: thermonuclease family protein [Pseudomonadota bacterium]